MKGKTQLAPARPPPVVTQAGWALGRGLGLVMVMSTQSLGPDTRSRWPCLRNEDPFSQHRDLRKLFRRPPPPRRRSHDQFCGGGGVTYWVLFSALEDLT